jgi:NAD(P)-dependent dehydrogenase (short-subunit alcohol dehydrogenase family)
MHFDSTMKLAGRTALVTGGATGLGRAFVQRLLEDGARVVIGDLRGADVAAAEEDSTGKCCFGVTMDVTDEASVADAVKAIDARFAGVDILINNAALFSTLENRPYHQRGLHVGTQGLVEHGPLCDQQRCRHNLHASAGT